MVNRVPDAEECLRLLAECGCSKKIIDHCLAVRSIALRIAAHVTKVNVQLIEAGALLHDIGRSKTHGITHAIVGARIAKEKGLSEEIICIIERHIGAGIPKEEAVLLGLPEKDFIPVTLEEKIVAHADNLTSGDKQQCIDAEINKALLMGYTKLAQRLRCLHEELSGICGVDLDTI